MEIKAVGMTDVGRVRAQNEDSFVARDDLALYVIADGMGGHVGGKTASSLAVQAITEYVEGADGEVRTGNQLTSAASGSEFSGIVHMLADSVRYACQTIFDRALGDVSLQGMGTTVVALFITADRAFVAHVGDSRCYLQRGDDLIQLTEDHSLVNEQIHAGLLTIEEARASHLKNIITRSVGFERDVAVDTLTLPLLAGDKLLLCSDGVSNLVDDAEFSAALRHEPLEAVPPAMIALANARGGDDNLTLICVGIDA